MKIDLHLTLLIFVSGLPATAIAAENAAQRAVQTAGSISDGDFPAIAIRRSEQGTVLASFTIGADGRAKDCETYSAQNIPVLEAVTCFIIRERFVFSPARDATGQATTETRSQRITWRLPGQEQSNQTFTLPALRTATLGISYRVQSNGYITNCVATGTTFDGSDIAKICDELKWRTPIRDERGEPAAKRVIEKHSVEVNPDP